MSNEPSCHVCRGMLRRGAASRRGGQVLIIALLSLTLLVGLIFYVYNIGDVMNRRLDLQSTSDAVAVSGAGWMARSMNLLAGDNVGMSRSLASVVVLDSLPLATQMSLDEVDENIQGLNAQLSRGLPNDAGGQYLQQGLSTLQQRLATEQQILQPVDQTLNHGAFDMTNTTHWAVRGANGPQPQGALWQSIVAMDNLSQATVASAGIVAQADATAFARADNTPTAFLTPILPVIPARRATFDDFQPTLMGSERVDSGSATMQPTGGPRGGARGGAIPDMEYPHRLGPWARLYRWRNYQGNNLNPPQNNQSPPPLFPGGNLLGGTGALAGTPLDVGPGLPPNFLVTGYWTFGPYSWMIQRISDWADGNMGWTGQGQLPDTSFSRELRDISRVKLNYMFPAGVGKQPQTIHYPLWITDYPQAKTLGNTPNVRVTGTLYYVVQIASSVMEGDSKYLSPGSFRTNASNPISAKPRGWMDLDVHPQWSRIGSYVWKNTTVFSVISDPEIGIIGKKDAQGNPIPQNEYVIGYYVFGGIDVGGDVQVSNPADWDSIENLPAPMLLDTSAGDYDPVAQDPDAGFRRDRFTYLGAAYRPATAKLYPTRFSTGVSAPMVALSQAKVFNNSSWDFWTQDWQVQLDPVTHLVPPDSGNWQQKLTDGVNDYSAVRDWVDMRDIQTIQNYLSQFDANTTGLYLNH